MSNTDSAIVTISNRLGLHARPAMMLAEAAMRYESEVTIQRLDQGKAVDAKSIMQLMMLAAVCGTELVEASGSMHPNGPGNPRTRRQQLQRGFA